MNQRYPNIKQSVILLILIFIIQTVVSFVLIMLLTAFNKRQDPVLITGFVNLVVIGFFIFHSLKYFNNDFIECYSFRKFPTSYLLIGIVLIAGLSIIVSEIDNFTRIVLPMPESIMNIFTSLIESPSGVFASILTLSIVAPLTEELLFRGLFLGSFLTRMSKKKAVVLSSLLFALFHMNPWQFFGPFIIGILFSYLYLLTKSIVPGIILHSLINFLPILVIRILKLSIKGYSTNLSTVEFQPLWFNSIGLALIGISILSYWMLVKRHPLSPRKSEET